MFDMSWGEIMVIGGVALIVIGPKDLPKALRTVGQMTSKVRRLAGEFQAQFSEAMREAELEDVKKEMEGLHRDVSAGAASGFNPIQTIRDELKGAVDGRPVSPPTDWRSDDPLPPLAEPPGTPSPDPSTLNPDRTTDGHGTAAYVDPDIQPLVPLNVDEPTVGPRTDLPASSGDGHRETPSTPPASDRSAGPAKPDPAPRSAEVGS